GKWSPCGRRLQGDADGFQDLVEVRQLRRLVRPRGADDPVGADEEDRARRDVPEAAEVEGDAEAARRVAVEVGEQGKVEVEGLGPRDVRPRLVARDGVRLRAGRAKLVAPVTQELELARSGRGPVEEVEDEEDRPVAQDLVQRRALLRRRPDTDVPDALADADHAAARSAATSVTSAMSRTTSTMSRFALKTRSCRSAPFPRRRIASTASSSRSEPSSRACGATIFRVRLTICATGCRLRRPVARSITGASRP